MPLGMSRTGFDPQQCFRDAFVSHRPGSHQQRRQTWPGERIVISLKPAGDEIALTVTDDGIGFSDETKKSGGMGLHIMKYRAGVVDAALEVRSGVDGAGTTVACVFRKNL